MTHHPQNGSAAATQREHVTYLSHSCTGNLYTCIVQCTHRTLQFYNTLKVITKFITKLTKSGANRQSWFSWQGGNEALWGEETMFPLTFSLLENFLPKTLNSGLEVPQARSPPFWGNYGAKLQFWRPMSSLS